MTAGACVPGKITMDQLPFVLAGAEVEATAEQIHEAIEARADLKDPP